MVYKASLSLFQYHLPTALHKLEKTASFSIITYKEIEEPTENIRTRTTPPQSEAREASDQT